MVTDACRDLSLSLSVSLAALVSWEHDNYVAQIAASNTQCPHSRDDHERHIERAATELGRLLCSPEDIKTPKVS